jgi:hypothetical protein
MENKKLTITIPTLPLAAFSTAITTATSRVKQSIQNIIILFSETASNFRSQTKKRVSFSSLKFRNPFNKFSRKTSKKLLMLVIPALLIVVFITVAVQTFRQSQQSTVANAEDNNTGILDATILDKPFSFPLTNESGKEIGNFSYEIQQAELRNEIIVKGQRAYAADGRVFLIINLQLKNGLKQGLQINSRDYVRLSVNGNKEELLAPEIHNDPVEVQAISTKFTRVGFAVNDKDQDFVLIVGEIDGDKQEIPVKF